MLATLHYITLKEMVMYAGGVMLVTLQDWTRLPCFVRSPVSSLETTCFVQPGFICQAKQQSVMDLLQTPQMLSLGCIQMVLYFSLEDGSKKMAGTGVVSQCGTDLELVENLLHLLPGGQSVSQSEPILRLRAFMKYMFSQYKKMKA